MHHHADPDVFISSRPRSFTLYDPPSISSKQPTIPLALASLHLPASQPAQ